VGINHPSPILNPSIAQAYTPPGEHDECGMMSDEYRSLLRWFPFIISPAWFPTHRDRKQFAIIPFAADKSSLFMRFT
jgi:hypothetical protein